MDFRPAPSKGKWIGWLLVATLVGIEALIVAALRRIGTGPLAAGLAVLAIGVVPLIARSLYWLWGVTNLRYRVGRDGIAIRWAAITQIIPMTAISHVLNGRPYADRLRGFHWPGHEVGHTIVATDDGLERPTVVYATAGPERQLLIVTPQLAYAISPADRAAFIAEFRIRRRLGPVQELRQETLHAPWMALSLWRDSLPVRLLSVAALLVVLSFAWLLWHYPHLPEQVDLSLAASGADPLAQAAVRSRDQLWSMPVLAASATLVNWILAGAIHRRARVAAVLLACGAFLVALALWVTMIRIVVAPA